MSVIVRSPQAWTPVPADVADEELVRRVRRRDQRAFEAIYERYREPLYRYCHSIMRQPEDAEEAFQATMLSAYQALSSGEEREIALRPWLYRIAHNACIDAVRRRPRHDAAALTGREAAPGDVGAQTELAEDLRQLQRDLAALPDAQRSALVMRELGGLSHADIGRALSEDAAAVKQLIYSARTTLHELASGRDLACSSVRQTLSDGDGRSLRGRGLRAHLRSCAGCRSWQAGLHARPAKLAAIAPVLSAAAFHQIFLAVTGTAAAAGLGAGAIAATAGAGAVGGAALGGGAAAGGGAAIGGTAAVAGAGASAGAATSGLAAKLAAIGSATLIGGGTAVVPAYESAVREPAPPARVAVVPATTTSPAATSVVPVSATVLDGGPPAADAALGAPGLDRAREARQEARERMMERPAERIDRTDRGVRRSEAAAFRTGEPGARATRRDAAERIARAEGRAERAGALRVARLEAAAARAQRRAEAREAGDARRNSLRAGARRDIERREMRERALAPAAPRTRRDAAGDPAGVRPPAPTVPVAPGLPGAPAGEAPAPETQAVTPDVPAVGTPAPGDGTGRPPAGTDIRRR